MDFILPLMSSLFVHLLAEREVGEAGISGREGKRESAVVKGQAEKVGERRVAVCSGVGEFLLAMYPNDFGYLAVLERKSYEIYIAEDGIFQRIPLRGQRHKEFT